MWSSITLIPKPDKDTAKKKTTGVGGGKKTTNQYPHANIFKQKIKIESNKI